MENNFALLRFIFEISIKFESDDRSIVFKMKAKITFQITLEKYKQNLSIVI